MNNDWAFLPMRSSTALLGDPAALHRRLAKDGYLWLEQVLDPTAVQAVRHDICNVLHHHGWIAGGDFLDDAVAIGRPVDEGHDEFAACYDDVQKLESFHCLAHHPSLTEVMRQVVGPTAFPHPLKVARLAFPSNYEVSTPPHQDYPNNQGSPNLTAAWIPMGDCPRELGALAVLRGSHNFGVLDLEIHPGPGNRQAVVTREMQEKLRWVTTDFRAGDVLLFTSHTVHAALHNATEFNMRLSVDFRYQPEGEPLTDLVLEPHFGRLNWTEIYAGWSSHDLRYYWADLDFAVVPFAGHAERAWDADTSTGLKAEMGGMQDDDVLTLTEDDWRTILTVEQRIAHRHQRRMQRLAELPTELPTERSDTTT